MAADALFVLAGSALAQPEAAGLGKKIKGVYCLQLTGPDNQYVIDMKELKVYKGPARGKVDVTLTISERDFLDLLAQKVDPQQAFMQGKIKISGNLSLLLKLLAMEPKIRNLAKEAIAKL